MGDGGRTIEVEQKTPGGATVWQSVALMASDLGLLYSIESINITRYYFAVITIIW